MRRALLVAVTVMLGFVLLAAIIVIAVSNTDFGRERVRGFALGALRDKAHGLVRIGRVEGNLLTGMTLHDVTITDSAGLPFVSAERVTTRYDLVGLMGKRVALSDVHLVRPVIVLSKVSGGEWNFRRIFPRDSASKPDTTFGFGDWITFRDVTLENGRFMVRLPWSPPDTLSPAQRDSAISLALGGTGRSLIEAAPGGGSSGYQRVLDFRSLHGRLPGVRLKHPDSSGIAIEVASLRAIAAPFRPPVAEIRDLSGILTIAKDTLLFRDLALVLPGSRIAGRWTYRLDTRDMEVRLRADPVALADLRWLYPRLPSQGGGPLDFVMLRGQADDFVIRNANIKQGSSVVAGNFAIRLGDSTVIHDTDLKLSSLETRLIERLVPRLDLPRQGTLGGRVQLEGSTRALRTTADVTFDDTRSGVSHVIAQGEMGIAGGFRARDLRVRAAPVQVDLARIFLSDLPMAGTVTGVATLDGSPQSRLVITRANVVHRDRGTSSHVTGRATVAFGGRRFMDVDVRVTPLNLTTVNRFVPALGLHGVVSGDVKLRGEFSALSVHADLVLPDGGKVRADGTLDVASKEIGYDLAVRVDSLDVKSVIERSPHTSLTASATARGRGFDPATMRSTLFAELAPSTLDSVAIDSLQLRVAATDGLATVDSISIRTSFARADLGGTIGLVQGRIGTLSYRVQVDSLSGLARWIPGTDTGTVRARPKLVADALARARADSAEVARVTEIEREVRGDPPLGLQVDTTGMSIPRDSLSGSVYTAGVLHGSIPRFDLRGRAALSHVVVRGNTMDNGRVEYAWQNAPAPGAGLIVAAQLDTVRAAGFDLDSVDVRLTYRKPNGELLLSVVQDSGVAYRVAADFSLHLDHKEIHLSDLALRFDTTTWQSNQSGAIRWGRRGIEIETIDLRSGPVGRIYVHGLVPTEGVADMEIAVQGLEISHVVRLLESDIQATGVVALSTRVQGSSQDPMFKGVGGLTAASFRGRPLPDARMTFEYGNQRVTTHAEFLGTEGKVMAVADGSLPLNLAFSGVSGSRVLNEPLTIDLRADGLELERLPSFSDAVADVSGRASGAVAVRGTFTKPAIVGGLLIDNGALRIVNLGVAMREVTGSVRMSGDSLFIDSLAGRTRGAGPVRVRGSIHLATLAKPGFDLRVTATDALVLDNDRGRMRADATMTVKGPNESVRIAGQATVRNGVLYIPQNDKGKVISTGDPAVFSVLDTSVAATDDIIQQESSLLRNLIVDVEVRVNRGMWVRSSEANVEVFTPEDRPLAIDIDRRENALRVEGTLNTERGEYEFYGRRFVITRGAATFIGTPEPNPLLQLVGEHEVNVPGREALVVRVVIGGTLRNPRLALESNAQPPIPQSDLLSYLAFGQSSSSVLQFQGSGLSGQGSGSGKLGGKVASLATRQLAAVAVNVLTKQAESDLARSLGADVLNISPAPLPTELSTSGVETVLRGTEVEVGKYVNASTFLALQARPTTETLPGIRLEYRMPKGYRIETSIESRFLLREPSLSSDQQPVPLSVFGLFLIREWRF